MLARAISCPANPVVVFRRTRGSLVCSIKYQLDFVDKSHFHELQFIFWLIALDTVVLTASLMVNGRAGTNLYLAYFLLIIVCAIFENPRVIAIISLVAPFIYAALFFDDRDQNSASYLQLVFLIIVDFFMVTLRSWFDPSDG